MKGWMNGWRSLLALTTLVGAAAFAHESKVSAAEVPSAVRDAVKAQFPKATAERYSKDIEHGQTEYEVRLKEGKEVSEASFSSDGKLLSQEVLITAAQLPEPVRAGLAASPYAKAKILKAEKELKGDTTHYELHVLQNGKRSEVVFDEHGKLVKPDED
jgi:uncharacterized membrane protein YkoI